MATVAAPPNPSAADLKLVRTSELLKLGGDPTRARVLVELRDAPIDSAALADVVGVDRHTFAPHLRLLKLANVLDTERDGRLTVYLLTPIGRRLLDAIELLGGDRRN